MKEEEKKKVTVKKKRFRRCVALIPSITGNRLCVLSNSRFSHLYLFSSPLLVPEWHAAPRPKLAKCCFGDGPGRYLDPQTRLPYCSLACARRLRRERAADLTLSLQAPVAVKPELPSLPSKQPVSSVPKPVQQVQQMQQMQQVQQMQPMQQKQQVQQRQQTQQQVQQMQKVQQKPQQPQQQMQPQQQPQKPQPNPPKQAPPRPLQTGVGAGKLQRPLRVSLTTPQGELLQYDLNTAKAIYINSQAVNVPVNLNQVYYLQTEVNGEKTVQPHLMTGTNRFTDGNVYYCMVPMVLVSSTRPK